MLLKEFIKLDANIDTIIKTVKHAKLNAKYCECCLEYTNVKNNLIECKCFCCNKNYQK